MNIDSKIKTAPGYAMHCVICLSTKNLLMFPQRLGKHNAMCGWSFVCSECADKYETHDIRVAVKLGETQEEEDDTRRALVLTRQLESDFLCPLCSGKIEAEIPEPQGDRLAKGLVTGSGSIRWKWRCKNMNCQYSLGWQEVHIPNRREE